MRVRFIYSSRHTKTIDPFNQHRIAFPQIAKDVIRISDIVLEIVDARYVDKTRNIFFEEHVKSLGKVLIYVINKVDLVDEEKLKEKLKEMKLYPYVLFSAINRTGRKELRQRIQIEVKRLKIEKNKGFKIAHVGVVGYPNTGKSTLINYLVGRHAAGTASTAGYTKGMQKVKLAKNILLLDTPGVIPEGEDSTKNKDDLTKHTEIGVRRYDKVKDPEFVVSQLMKDNPCLFEKYFDIDAKGDAEVLLEKIGKKQGFIQKGNKIDFDRAARFVLKAWQDGNLKK